MAEEKDIQDTLNLINKNRNLLTSDFKMLLPDNFEIPNIEKWKNIFNNITSDFKAFDTTNYNSWKTANALESPEAYIKHNFNALAGLMNQDGNMVENMHTAIYGNTKNNKKSIFYRHPHSTTPPYDFTRNRIRTYETQF